MLKRSLLDLHVVLDLTLPPSRRPCGQRLSRLEGPGQGLEARVGQGDDGGQLSEVTSGRSGSEDSKLVD